ncbi:hypothetical protein [Herbiconiux flava]|uniref:Protein kinase domain-containing protein n=1 Tax=Herbiconiux flava TaxID=881268 RepID=A0A852SQF8_9MICO|nr:hypothetical protein [Herbiconiux flava]NYD71022.1 hypothetical protein [Herbiconiux flava]
MSEREGQEQVVSRAAGIRVREVDLGGRAPIGSGAATEVLRLDSFTVPGHQGGVAFVRVRDGKAPEWDSAVLSRLVALRWALDARERGMLDAVAAWPLAVVEGDGGGVVGCLVPLAAHPFYYVPADDPEHRKVTQNAKWLISAPKRARRAGAAAVPERDVVARATVLARVSLLLEVLHRNGVVFGDLSERSVLFGAGEVASAFVVGCEGAAFAGEGVLQRNSAGWAAPSASSDFDLSREPSVQSVETDRYKLGLLVLRVLAPAGDGLDRSRDASRAAGVLDEPGQRMLDRALGDDPAARPTAADWYGYLRGLVASQLAAPVIRGVSVSPSLVAEGDEVRLTVEVDGAREVVIEMPGRADIRREVAGRLVTERFTARQSGRIGVRASNAHGSAAALNDVVRVLPIPTPARIAVASPSVPAALGVLPDLASLEAAMGISLPPGNPRSSAATTRSSARDDSTRPVGTSTADSSATTASATTAGSTPPDVSPFDRVAALRARLEADALPLHDILRIGIEAERASREPLFPTVEHFLADVDLPNATDIDPQKLPNDEPEHPPQAERREPAPDEHREPAPDER